MVRGLERNVRSSSWYASVLYSRIAVAMGPRRGSLTRLRRRCGPGRWGWPPFCRLSNARQNRQFKQNPTIRRAWGIDASRTICQFCRFCRREHWCWRSRLSTSQNSSPTFKPIPSNSLPWTDGIVGAGIPITVVLTAVPANEYSTPKTMEYRSSWTSRNRTYAPWCLILRCLLQSGEWLALGFLLRLSRRWRR